MGWEGEGRVLSELKAEALGEPRTRGRGGRAVFAGPRHTEQE